MRFPTLLMHSTGSEQCRCSTYESVARGNSAQWRHRLRRFARPTLRVGRHVGYPVLLSEVGCGSQIGRLADLFGKATVLLSCSGILGPGTPGCCTDWYLCLVTYCQTDSNTYAKETGSRRATPTGAIATPTLVRATPTGAIATPTVVRAAPTGAGATATAVPAAGAGATATAVPVNRCVVDRPRDILRRRSGVRDPG